MQMKNIFLSIFLFFLFFSEIKSQSFTASVSSNPVSLDQQFELSFTVSGQDVNGISGFKAPGFKDFITLSGPNQSTSMQIINGAMSGSVTYSYYLQPREVGKFTIGGATINYKGKILTSNSITIEVIKGTRKPQQNTKQQNQTVSNQEIGENLFIKAFVDKNTVYQGEQVTVTYKLFTRVNISSPQVSKLPSYQGFWSEEIETPQNILFTREVIDGKTFNVGVLKKAALFPTQSGDLSVTPFELKIPVMIQKRRSNNLFDDFFNDPFFNPTETVEYTARSNTVKVKVLPLPPKTEESFNGAVGNFSFKVDLDKKKTKQNEPVSLKIEINGTGNISLIEPPKIELPSGFESYDPKISDNINRSGVISGRKSFEYLIVPRIDGIQEIPGIKFTYFNPQKKDYITLSSGPFQIEIEKGSGDYTGVSGLSKEEIKLLDQDIHYIKIDVSELRNKGTLLISKTGFWVGILAIISAFSGLIIWKRKEDNLAGNLQLMKNLRAEKIAKKSLKMASRFLAEKKSEKFYEEISRAIIGYLENKLSLPKADLSFETASLALRVRNVDSMLIESLLSTIQKCEFIKYAPVTDGVNDMQSIYSEAVNLIVKLEQELNKRN